MPTATRTQDRFAALESRVELMAGEIVELRMTVQTFQDALQATKAQVAKVEDRIARVDPGLSDPTSPHYRRYASQRRGIKLMGLPDELLRMIVDHVATVDRPGDDEDYLLPSRFELLDKQSLRSLSTTSKAMYEHVRPAVWRHVVIDSPAALLRLTKGLVSAPRSCETYIHSIECSPLLSYQYPLSTARDVLLNLYEKDQGRAALSKDEQQRACNIIQPDLFLSKEESDLFAIQALVVIMPYLTALEAITADQNLLNILLVLKADHILPARVTHLRTSDRQRVHPFNLTLAQMENLSRQIYSMFTNLQLCLPVHNLFQWEVDPRKPKTNHLQTEVASLIIDYDFHQSGVDSTVAIENVQHALRLVSNLTMLQITSNDSYRVSPRRSLPFVSYPSTLRSLHIRGEWYGVIALIAGVSHVASVEHLKVENQQMAWDVPEALPPSLRTFKLMMPVNNKLSYTGMAMEALQRNLRDRKYPESLTHICLDQHTADKVTGVASQQSVIGALSSLDNATPFDTNLVKFLVAILRVDAACQERGIKLCGPRISRCLISPSFYETLPYRLLGMVLAKAESA